MRRAYPTRGCDSPGLPGEARLDPKQYGFRPGRGCHDAIEMIHLALAAKNAKREWVLDADLKSAFDRIDHNFLLQRIGTFPRQGTDPRLAYKQAWSIGAGTLRPMREPLREEGFRRYS